MVCMVENGMGQRKEMNASHRLQSMKTNRPRRETRTMEENRSFKSINYR
jgi:hypothetical protein